MNTRLTEAKGKNWKLSEQTRDALTVRMNRCLLEYILWQIEAHNRLRLREIEHCAAELIAKSGRRHCKLAKKLDVFLSRSRDAVANLELELVGVLKRLGLKRKLEGAATADSADLYHYAPLWYLSVITCIKEEVREPNGESNKIFESRNLESDGANERQGVDDLNVRNRGHAPSSFAAAGPREGRKVVAGILDCVNFPRSFHAHDGRISVGIVEARKQGGNCARDQS
ncbi:hypothetical protein AXG93_1502s1010 [Marchantia polymorpha subsp. ruderalis]|uniref:Uncharacterized protein n=1 Tax=Marchantia polymorpha subsp. ruderalis TaxID=1480154 RepID=A0A176WEI2_MARPO|nr:hypothetical protein AXG93_1502s1010 [Marchantia polymorpha subsp. ruderalis]